mgnify:CR=1 FL=1
MPTQRAMKAKLEAIRELVSASMRGYDPTEEFGINEEEYQHFQQCLANLTVKELDIFKLYLDGKSSKQIQEICAITSNTLKYHNANIYSKLGIKSRKELLTYATMMKEKERQDARP